jgi:hypothetical protein
LASCFNIRLLPSAFIASGDNSLAPHSSSSKPHPQKMNFSIEYIVLLLRSHMPFIAGISCRRINNLAIMIQCSLAQSNLKRSLEPTLVIAATENARSKTIVNVINEVLTQH